MLPEEKPRHEGGAYLLGIASEGYTPLQLHHTHNGVWAQEMRGRVQYKVLNKLEINYNYE
jgi:hypothetical protein